MKKHLLLLAASMLLIKVTYSQTNVGADTTAIGLGATSTTGGYKFTYQSHSVAHYGLGWYDDADATAYGPMGYFGGFGGIKLFTGGAPRFTITANGQVGIGTTSPQAPFHVKIDNNFSVIQRSASTNYAGLYYVTGPDNALSFNFLTGLRENSDDYHIFNGEEGVDAITVNHTTNFVGIGTTAPVDQLQVTGNIFAVAFNSIGELHQYNATGGAYIAGHAGSPYADIAAYADASGTPKALVLNKYGGNVGIGVVAPQNKLDVNGTVHSKQVVVDMIGWSDYVFKPTYTLPALSEVKDYIKKNQHLPGIPSEHEIVEKGLNLGEMNKLLVKKNGRVDPVFD